MSTCERVTPVPWHVWTLEDKLWVGSLLPPCASRTEFRLGVKHSLTEAIWTMPEIFADSIFYLKIFAMIYKNQTTVITALQGIAFLLISQKTINFLVFCFD